MLVAQTSGNPAERSAVILVSAVSEDRVTARLSDILLLTHYQCYINLRSVQRVRREALTSVEMI